MKLLRRMLCHKGLLHSCRERVTAGNAMTDMCGGAQLTGELVCSARCWCFQLIGVPASLHVKLE